jgi:hypothetical protein
MSLQSTLAAAAALLVLANKAAGQYYYGNTGYGNTGYTNTGYGNTGYTNTGYGNTGYTNTGYTTNTGYNTNTGYTNANTNTGGYTYSNGYYYPSQPAQPNRRAGLNAAVSTSVEIPIKPAPTEIEEERTGRDSRNRVMHYFSHHGDKKKIRTRKFRNDGKKVRKIKRIDKYNQEDEAEYVEDYVDEVEGIDKPVFVFSEYFDSESSEAAEYDSDTTSEPWSEDSTSDSSSSSDWLSELDANGDKIDKIRGNVNTVGTMMAITEEETGDIDLDSDSDTPSDDRFFEEVERISGLEKKAEKKLEKKIEKKLEKKIEKKIEKKLIEDKKIDFLIDGIINTELSIFELRGALRRQREQLNHLSSELDQVNEEPEVIFDKIDAKVEEVENALLNGMIEFEKNKKMIEKKQKKLQKKREKKTGIKFDEERCDQNDKDCLEVHLENDMMAGNLFNTNTYFAPYPGM